MSTNWTGEPVTRGPRSSATTSTDPLLLKMVTLPLDPSLATTRFGMVRTRVLRNPRSPSRASSDCRSGSLKTWRRAIGSIGSAPGDGSCMARRDRTQGGAGSGGSAVPQAREAVTCSPSR